MSAPTDVYLSLGGLGFHYREWSSEGLPLVLLHGLASNCRIWDLAAPLLARRYRVLALDQRGHGESAKPLGDYGFSTVVEDVHAFVTTLGLERPVVVGHSWGGNVALQYAVEHPQDVTALALVDGGFLEPSRVPGMTWERAEQELAPPPLDGMPLEDFLERLRERVLQPVWGPEVERIVLANFHLHADGTISPRLSRESHMRIVRALWEQHPSRLYAQVGCPVLLVPARQENPPDERTARFLEAKREMVALAEQRLPRSQTRWMEETIHDIPLQRPRELAQAIEGFVESVSS